MSELFHEVDEELRREQLQKLWNRYSIFIVGAAILIVAAVAGWRAYQYFEAKKAAETGAAFESALAITNPAEAQAAFNKIATEGTGGYRALARLHAAAEAAKQDPQNGAKAFDAIAADTGLDSAVRDVARLRAASFLLDTASYDEINQRLSGYAGGTNTFRHSARELLALSAWRANNIEAARQWLDMIGSDPESPSSLRTRAEALQALLPSVAKS